MTNISQSFYLQDGLKNQTGIDMEQNYVTITLFIAPKICWNTWTAYCSWSNVLLSILLQQLLSITFGEGTLFYGENFLIGLQSLRFIGSTYCMLFGVLWI